MWEIKYVSTEKELDEENYNESIEWVEDHRHTENYNHCELFKYKKEELRENNGYPYCLIVWGEESENWAENHYRTFDTIIRTSRDIYVSHNLEGLLEFVDEIKKA